MISSRDEELVEPKAFWAFLEELSQEIDDELRDAELAYEPPWEELK